MKTKGRQNGNFEIGLLAVGFLAKEDLRPVWVRGAKWIGWKAGGHRLIRLSAAFTDDLDLFGVNDSNGGTRGQLTGGTVEVQVVSAGSQFALGIWRDD